MRDHSGQRGPQRSMSRQEKQIASQRADRDPEQIVNLQQRRMGKVRLEECKQNVSLDAPALQRDVATKRIEHFIGMKGQVRNRPQRQVFRGIPGQVFVQERLAVVADRTAEVANHCEGVKQGHTEECKDSPGDIPSGVTANRYRRGS
jgi:hypothetical protein